VPQNSNAPPRVLLAQWGPHQRQRFTSVHSQEHHTEDRGSTSPSSSFTISPIRASQVQFQMICVVSGVLPVLKSPFFFLSVVSGYLFCIIASCTVPRIPQKHNKDVFTAWDSCVLEYSLMLHYLDACHCKILQAV